MAAKEQALAKSEAMQNPEPKRRRTAQEQALAPLLKERAKIAAKLVEAQENATAVAAQLLRLDKMIDAIRETDDEPSPESE
jgi:hypothetical protein